jgi:hypothetical protein
MAGIAIYVGTAEEAQKPTGYEPPPESGIYSGKIVHGEVRTWDDGSKPPMLRVNVRCTKTAGGDPCSGFVEWFAFSISPEQEEAFSRYNPGSQKWRLRNFFGAGLGGEAALEKMGQSAKKSITIDPDSWKDREVFVDVSVYDDEYNGVKRRRGRVEAFLTASDVAEKTGATDSEKVSLETAISENPPEDAAAL